VDSLIRGRAHTRIVAGAVVLGLAVFIGVFTALSSDEAASCRRTLIPTYVTPDVIDALPAAHAAERTIIVNPASGPGPAAQPAYASAVARAQAAGTRVLGYVPTGYGARDAALVREEIDRYRSWYRVDGIFLDEASASAEDVPHYRALSDHVRGFTVLNPGLVPAREYFSFADVVVTYEGSAADYGAAVRRAPGWLEQVPRERIAHLLYGAARGPALEAVGLSARAGYLYVTDGSLPHPWGSIPPYLGEQEAALAQNCGH
jgi:hypothetical protein